MARTSPVVATEVPGNAITGALWNAQVGGMGNWFLGSGTNGPPRFSARQTIAQSAFASGQTFTALLLDTEDFDSDNGHSTLTNTSQYVVQVAGLYALSGSISFPASATGVRAAAIHINSTLIQGLATEQAPAGSGNSWVGCVAGFRYLSVGDIVDMRGWQTSGGPLAPNTGTGGNNLSLFWLSN
jgi:hypothetical protein